MDEQDFRSERVLRIAEDALRQGIIDASPQIHADVQLMAKMIRELVDLERAKLGLDRPRGTIELYPNKDKKGSTDPDFIGSGRVAGRFYSAALWHKPNNKLRVSLLPRKRS